jgi:hypothetical protein
MGVQAQVPATVHCDHPKLKPVISNIFLDTMSFGSSPEVDQPCLNLVWIP